MASAMQLIALLGLSVLLTSALRSCEDETVVYKREIRCWTLNAGRPVSDHAYACDSIIEIKRGSAIRFDSGAMAQVRSFAYNLEFAIESEDNVELGDTIRYGDLAVVLVSSDPRYAGKVLKGVVYNTDGGRWAAGCDFIYHREYGVVLISPYHHFGIYLISIELSDGKTIHLNGLLNDIIE